MGKKLKTNDQNDPNLQTPVELQHAHLDSKKKKRKKKLEIHRRVSGKLTSQKYELDFS